MFLKNISLFIGGIVFGFIMYSIFMTITVYKDHRRKPVNEVYYDRDLQNVLIAYVEGQTRKRLYINNATLSRTFHAFFAFYYWNLTGRRRHIIVLNKWKEKYTKYIVISLFLIITALALHFSLDINYKKPLEVLNIKLSPAYFKLAG